MFFKVTNQLLMAVIIMMKEDLKKNYVLSTLSPVLW